MSELKGFSERLRIRRSELGLTQSELSKKSGVAVPQLSRYELGQVLPRTDTVIKLAKALGVTYGWLFFGTNPEELLIPGPQIMPSSEVRYISENTKSNELLSICLPLLEQVQTKLAIQKNSFQNSENFVSSPFTKYEIHQAKALIHQAQSLLNRTMESINELGIQIKILHHTFKEHEEKFKIMSQHGKIDDYYNEQIKSAIKSVSEVIPEETSLELFETKNKKDEKLLYDAFFEWLANLEIPESKTELEIFQEIDNAITYLANVATLASANIHVQRLLRNISSGMTSYTSFEL